jgi:hypothetical protein
VPKPRAHEIPMPDLSEHDSPPDGSGGRPPLLVAIVIAVVVTAVVVLHLLGVFGPGSH